MKISELKGIGEKTEKVFNKAGIYTTDDLLKYYPRNYDIYELPVLVNNVEYNKMCAIKATVARNVEIKRIRKLQIVTAFLIDENKNPIKATWFNATYLRNTLRVGSTFVFRGVIKENRGSFVIEQPKIYTIDEYKLLLNTMQPIYPLVMGMTNKLMTKTIKQASEIELPIKDFLPSEIKDNQNLIDLSEAIYKIHFPQNAEELQIARKRMVFNEFFEFIYSLRKFKNSECETVNNNIIKPVKEIETLIENLPYKLTNAQIRTWNEIKNDLNSNRTMNRLVQGDVGSGKTIVAFLGLISAALNGFQGAIMVPTEVLALQHLESFNELVDDYNIDVKAVLLSGSMKAAEKRETYKLIESGEAQVIIGTHALIQEAVNYKKLGLVITDEQHRFGVRQREAISNKGNMPHILVMSATPIPRTLAIIMYGDLDISIIDELPANRLPIKNCVVGTNYRPNAYKFMSQQIEMGHQIYIICPTVEYSEAVEGENVIEYCEKLQSIFPLNVKIEYLHGKMKPAQKNEIMNRFSTGEIQILVSTTVVEVGVNVPNATVMMIENAERFGLAGLHQLRGRVGRGKFQSYCIFINGTGTKKATERLDILVQSNDGFKIASEDLKLRGPGDFFGVRQSGDIEFKIADIYSDANILKNVSDIIDSLENNDICISESERTDLESYINNYIVNTGLNI